MPDAIPYGATEDADVVVGGISNTAFIWNATNGVTDPGFLQSPLAGPNHTTEAQGVSANGRVVIGTSTVYNQTRDISQAFIWTPKRGMRRLGGPKNVESYAKAISANGKVVVGDIFSERGSLMAVWRNGKLARRFRVGTTGGAVSADGRWVVGFDATQGTGGLFRWSKMTGLQDLDTTGNTFNFPRAVSDDGGVIVGQGADGTPFRWTAEGGIASLGVSTENGSGYATGVSADGRTIIGWFSSVGAFIWKQEDGLRGLKPALESDFGLDLTGWSLGGASWISGDGAVILGHGHLNGEARAWIVRPKVAGPKSPPSRPGKARKRSHLRHAPTMIPSPPTTKRPGNQRE